MPIQTHGSRESITWLRILAVCLPGLLWVVQDTFTPGVDSTSELSTVEDILFAAIPAIFFSGVAATGFLFKSWLGFSTVVCMSLLFADAFYGLALNANDCYERCGSTGQDVLFVTLLAVFALQLVALLVWGVVRAVNSQRST